MQETTSACLQIGVLGTAGIARDFIASVAPSRTVKIAAVASRKLEKATRFAQDTGIARAYGAYEELLADRSLDAIYNPLPNSLHAEWSIRALEAGKHVLCEKPLAVTAVEARSMFAAARRHGRTLVEGFPYRAQPHTIRLKELVDAGAIGALQSIWASFGFVAAPPDIRLDPALAGQRPTRVAAMARWHASGVEQTLIASLEHRDGLLAQISCSLATSPHRQALIAGTAGVIQTSYLNFPPLDRPAVMQLRRGESWDAPYEAIESPPVDAFRAEAESFERLIRLGPEQWTGATSEESIDIMLTLEAIIESARTQRAVDVAE